MSLPQSPGSIWQRVCTRLREAEAAHPVMTGRNVGQRDRDAATDRYVRAVDAMVADLTELRRHGALSRLSRLLEAEERQDG